MHRTQANPAAGLEVLEGHVGEPIQMAQGEQALMHLLINPLMAARANLQPAEVGMADGEIEPQVAKTSTDRAIRVAGQSGCAGNIPGISVQ
jgi:hypothetical protein